MYPQHHDTPVPSSPSFDDVERGILAFWKGDNTFQASIDQRAGADEWVFYDGPPFANGLPHYGHLLTGYAKDIFPRFQTMRGKQVPRRFGWDTHGLPAELEAMKQLGLTEKSEIEAMGVDTFNAHAKSSVLRYVDEWEEYVTRQARWVDFKNDYKTLNLDYMESVLWAFKQLHDKGLAYEGYRVLPYCWRDETPLSNHELRMDDDVYQMRQDPAVTVGVRMDNGDIALVWTTTPWTLPANLAIMVGADIDYVTIETDVPTGTRERYVIAAARASHYARELTGSKDGDVEALIVERRTGAELVGSTYTPPFSYYLEHEGAFRVLEADFVTTTDGTGLVHTAAAFGEDDMRITDANGIAPVMPVDDAGKFFAPVNEYAGLQVFAANAPIVHDLKAATRGEVAGSVSPGTVLLRQETYDHSYPHCWRCRNPLIYKAVSSWFVRVTEIKDDLLAANEAINWVPENVKHGQFGKWLEGARDWSISRNRYWGSPIPVWKSDNPEFPRIDVYGSLDEIERDFGVRPTDLHRPFIDELTRPNPDDPSGASTMRRIPDVLDVWFDSGSMPFAQVHFPFENEAWFGTHSPADYIVEYVGQTRGWFYVLHVLSVALFGRPAFRNVISHGIVLGNDGFKASKSRRNYPDVNESFEKYGSDAVRWMQMSSPILRGGNLIVTEEAIREALRQFHLPLWSTWYFFSTYANRAVAGAPYEARWRTDSEHVLDRYILAKLGQTVGVVGDALEALDATGASIALRDFVDVLTNWYVRRSRDRFWAGVADDGAGADAFDTLYTVLETLTRLAAPLAPLVTEEVWRGLTGGRSVHLTDWPDAAEFPADDALVAQMDAVRQIASAGNALRKQAKKRVRLPLPALSVVADSDVAGFTSVIADELNVREVRLSALAEDSLERYGIGRSLQVNARAAGPRLGKRVQEALKAAKAGQWSIDGERVTAGGIELHPGEYELKLEVSDPDSAVAFLPDGGFVVLDTTTTPELEAEGLARDVVRAVQDARRRAGLDVSDRIRLTLASDAAGVAAIDQNRELIANETLASALVVTDIDTATELRVGNDSPLAVQLERAV